MADRNAIHLPAGLKAQVQERNRRRQKGNEGRVKADTLAVVARNDVAPRLRSERRLVSELKDAERRVRRTSPEQLERVTRSVSQLGFLKPVLITADGQIVDGHILVEVAKRMQLPDIECSVIDHLTPAEIRMARIALNRLAETGAWHLEDLAIELEELDLANIDLDLSGFDKGELDLILGQGASMAALDKDVPSPPSPPIWCRRHSRRSCRAED